MRGLAGPVAARLLAGYLRHVQPDLLGLSQRRPRLVAGRPRAGPRNHVLRHPPLAGAADQGRVDHALLAHGPDVVEVRSGHAVRSRGLQRVAAPAVLAEERLALGEVLAALLRGERLRTLGRVAVGDKQPDTSDPESEVDDRNPDPEAAAALRQIGLALLARAAREGDERHGDADGE